MHKVYVVLATTLLLARSAVPFVTSRHCFKKEITIKPVASAFITNNNVRPHPNAKDVCLPWQESLFRSNDVTQRYAVSPTTPFPPLPREVKDTGGKDNTSSGLALEVEQTQKLLPIQSTFPIDAAETLDGRLICASQCAYNLTQPYFRSAGYRPDTVAKRVSRGVNSVLIGITHDGITVAFRGTQSSNSLDWIQNAALFLTPVGDRTGFKGKMHAGFYRTTKSLWKASKEVLVEMLKISDERGWNKEVYFTGHSKGGAMASVAALLMKRDGDLPDPAYVCTFGSARVGDSEFRDYYNKKISQTSYEAHLDIIPFLPPSASMMGNVNDELANVINRLLWSEKSSDKKNKYKWDYQTVGKRKFIDEFSNIGKMDVTKELDSRRIRDIENQPVLSLADFRAAHCSSCAHEGCYGYYFKAVGENSCTLCEENDDPGE